jgi:hypothetical protein
MVVMDDYYDVPDNCYCYPNYEGECARCLLNAEMEAEEAQ